MQALYRAGVQARADSALSTEAPFVERMVHFWSNHFCVSVDNPRVTAFAGAFERDAIRPHVLGNFADMMLPAERHPAMLIYLNQFQSIGPDSAAAVRNPDRKRGLNENFAREIMELHTLGGRSGYTQADVTEFARALTGWTIDGLGGNRAADRNPDHFVFRPSQHEPGIRTILGKRYAQDGEAQARAALVDFARAPATATHIATKLSRHVAGDDPPAMVVRLAESFLRSGGDLPTVYHTLIALPEAWAPTPIKFNRVFGRTVEDRTAQRFALREISGRLLNLAHFGELVAPLLGIASVCLLETLLKPVGARFTRVLCARMKPRMAQTLLGLRQFGFQFLVARLQIFGHAGVE